MEYFKDDYADDEEIEQEEIEEDDKFFHMNPIEERKQENEFRLPESAGTTGFGEGYQQNDQLQNRNLIDLLSDSQPKPEPNYHSQGATRQKFDITSFIQ